jgi:hypothetical protein
MAEAMQIEAARKAFVEVTQTVEDSTIDAADGQASPNLSAARQSCDRLIALRTYSFKKLHRRRRRLA